MELFKITYLKKTYYFTSYKDDITIDNITYTAIPISREEITKGLEENGLKITAPLMIEPFTNMAVQALTELGSVEIARYPQMITLYKGNILKTTRDLGRELITIYVGQKIILSEGQFPTRSYSATCGYNFGEKYCGVNRNNYAFSINSDNFTINEQGTLISSDAFSGKRYLQGGYIKTNNGFYNYIYQFYSDKNEIALLNALPNPTKISSITVYPTCDKSPEACSYYNNLDHFGGFPYIPNNNLTTGGF